MNNHPSDYSTKVFQKVTIYPTVLRWGTIASIGGIIFLGYFGNNSQESFYLVTTIAILWTFVCFLLSIKEFRDHKLLGEISFKKALKVTIVANFVSSTIWAIWLFAASLLERSWYGQTSIIDELIWGFSPPFGMGLLLAVIASIAHKKKASQTRKNRVGIEEGKPIMIGALLLMINVAMIAESGEYYIIMSLIGAALFIYGIIKRVRYVLYDTEHLENVTSGVTLSTDDSSVSDYV